jgi:hypothetical protein
MKNEEINKALRLMHMKAYYRETSKSSKRPILSTPQSQASNIGTYLENGNNKGSYVSKIGEKKKEMYDIYS